MSVSTYFPEDRFQLVFEGNREDILVVSPKDERMSKEELCSWASKEGRASLDQAIKQFGVIVFSGFKLKKEEFSATFCAIAGTDPAVYQGDSPRKELFANVYESTAVAPGRTIPLHQEVSGHREKMPQYIAFFCAQPPTPGIGRTVVGSAREVSEKLKNQDPALWVKMQEMPSILSTSLIFEDYVPQKGDWTGRAQIFNKSYWLHFWDNRIVRWLNPSHATVKKKFGTENMAEVATRCVLEGMKLEYYGNRLIVSRENVPGTIQRKGEKEPLFCNQLHTGRLTPDLCGGWINYLFASKIIYPTEQSRPYNSTFMDGSFMSFEQTKCVLDILKSSQRERDWREGDLMILDNVSTMHGKTPHRGPREILVAMGGKIAS